MNGFIELKTTSVGRQDKGLFYMLSIETDEQS